MKEAAESSLPTDLTEHSKRLLSLASDRNLTIATAESCTGGLLSALLTDISGLGHVFDRGIIAYSEQAKCDLLNIDRRQVDKCGAVSREIAIEMVKGALDRSPADIALAITGFAGPAGEDEEEGLVHFACARRGQEIVHREEHFGPLGRDNVRSAAAAVALSMMEDAARA